MQRVFESSVTGASFVSQLPADWRLARAARLNTLLIEDGAAQRTLDTCLLDLDQPVATWHPGERLELPTEAHGETIVLHDVGALSGDDQQRLLDWIERAAGRTQIVSTTSSSLLPQLARGNFDDRLYYRLNTICIDLTAKH